MRFTRNKPKYKRIAIPANLRTAILRRDGYKCQLCGFKPPSREYAAMLHIDHKQPVARGGTNDPRNLWALCAKCNLNKGDKPMRPAWSLRTIGNRIFWGVAGAGWVIMALAVIFHW